MIKILKYLLSGIYLLAIPATYYFNEHVLARYCVYFVGAVLIAHVAEVIIFYNRVKLYEGAMYKSVVLTILFGFLHWLPLSGKHLGKQ